MPPLPPVTSEPDWLALIERTLSTYGRLDILVNNAGIQSETPGDSFDDDALERILAVNLVGAALCARAVSAVSIQPGCTALTWMLSLAQAVASARLSCTMPPLLAA